MTFSGQVCVCSAGQTFDSVALEIYGDEKYACELLNANPLLCTKPIFTGGEELLLPVVEVSDTESEGMPATAPWKEV